jgi:hypothetical protein
MFHRADETNPAFDFTVVEHQAAGGNLYGGTTGLAVDQKNRTGIGETLQRLTERDRTVTLALDDREQAGLGRGAGMGVDRLPAGDHKTLGR